MKYVSIEEYLNAKNKKGLMVQPKTRDELKEVINKACSVLGINADLNFIDTSNITQMFSLFNGHKFNGDISKWDVSNVKDMQYMFYGSEFKGDISNWDVSNVKYMRYMFMSTSFNRDISKWNVSNVEDMRYMFSHSKFNGDISKWKINQSCDTNGMFEGSPLEFKYGVNGEYLKDKELHKKKELEQRANGASALQIESNPENVVFCFGRIPRDISFNVINYNVYKGWHEDGKACMLRYGFKEPIILTDNINASGVVALSKRYPGKVMTYDEFLDKEIIKSLAKKYSDIAFDNIKHKKVIAQSREFPKSYANDVMYDNFSYVLTESCFDGEQKGLFKLKYITERSYEWGDDNGYDWDSVRKQTFQGVAKVWFYKDGKIILDSDKFRSAVNILLENAIAKAERDKDEFYQ